MTLGQVDRSHRTRSEREAGLDITIRSGAGSGHTLLSAFDSALQGAGVADFNLVTLSSVIPPQSRIRTVEGATLPGGHGDLLLCVRAQAFADQPGAVAWAGLGWCVDETGGGLFVEHHGDSEESVVEQIEMSLTDMNAARGGSYGPVQMALASAESNGRPVCAVVVAAYQVSSWFEPQAPTRPAAGHFDLEAHEAMFHGDSAETMSMHASRLTDVVTQGQEPEHTGRVDHKSITVGIEKEVDFAAARLFYKLYLHTFDGLEKVAAARHVLTEEEFIAEMVDPRVDKYVARDGEGRPVGMTTLTNELAAVPWISPDYYAHHFPEQYARNAIYYLGITLVHPDYQRGRVFHLMGEPIVHRVLAQRGIVAWDMCTVNDEHGLSRAAAHIIKRFADATIEPVDRQTYYAAVFNGPKKKAPRRAAAEQKEAPGEAKA